MAPALLGGMVGDETIENVWIGQIEVGVRILPITYAIFTENEVCEIVQVKTCSEWLQWVT